VWTCSWWPTRRYPRTSAQRPTTTFAHSVSKPKRPASPTWRTSYARCAFVAEHLGHEPNSLDYKAAAEDLIARGEDIEPLHRVVRHYGSWRRAAEALGLSETETPKAIEARFKRRRLGQVWRYSEQTLRETLAQAAEHWGRAPSTEEYEHWRQRELELAKAQGKDALHIPAYKVFWKRFGGWEQALRHFSYDQADIEARLEQQ
jgi:hypothetical protein